MIRLFVGLSLPEPHRQDLALIQHGVKGLRWVAPENLHVTLRFIGEVDEDIAEEVCASLDQMRVEPFDFTLKGIGTFGRPPHSLWVGVHDPQQGALAHFQANVERCVVRAGLEPEGRKFSPHVTLARGRKSMGPSQIGPFMENHADFELPSFRINEFILFQSHLSPNGAQYSPYAVFDF